MNNFIAPIIVGFIAFALSLLHQEEILSSAAVYWVTGLSVIYAASYLVAWLFLSGRGADAFAGFLQKGGLGRIYDGALTAVLDRLDRWLCPPEFLDGKSPDLVQPPRPARAWNWRAYDRMLLIAVAYPVGLPMLIWMLTGRPAQLGNMTLLLGPEKWWQIPLTWGGVMVFVFCQAIAKQIHRESVWPILDAVYRAILARSAPPERGSLLALAALILAGAFAFIFAFLAISGDISSDIFVLTAILVWVIVLLSLTSVREIAVTGVYAFALAFGFTTAFAFGFIVILLFAVAVFLVVEYAATTRRFVRTAYILLTITALGVLVWVATFADTEQRGMLILFLGMFPLVNAIWDFASLGLTRWCLRQSTLKLRVWGLPAGLRPVIFNLIDICGALLALAGLILSLLFGVSLLNSVAPDPILPLTRLVIDLRPGAGGPDMTWVYLMVFSTLLPSLMHVVLFLTSLALRYPGRWARRKLAVNGAGEEARQSLMAGVVGLWVTLPVAALLLGWTYLLPHGGALHEGVITWILGQVSWVIAIFDLA